MEREESRQRGWATQKWLGLFLLEAAELSRQNLQYEIIWGLPPCSAWLCLGGPWHLAQYLSPTSRLWEILVGVGKGGREPENGAGLSCACCCLPWIWRKTFPTCHHALLGLCSPHPRRGLRVSAILLDLVLHWLLCTCVCCLQAPGIPRLAHSSQCIPAHLYFTT